MVGYEISLILRSVKKPATADALKRICTNIMKEGTIIKSMENLGERKLPYPMSNHNERFRVGRYFNLDIESSPSSVLPLKQKLKVDSDIIRATVLKQRT